MVETAFDPRSWVIVLLAVALALVCLMVVNSPETMNEIAVRLQVAAPLDRHAEAKHGAAVVAAIDAYVDACGGQGGKIISYYNPQTLRTAHACRLPDGTLAVQIARWVENVKRRLSSFPKEKMSSFDQVERYLYNRGYGRTDTEVFRMWLDAHPEHLPFVPPY